MSEYIITLEQIKELVENAAVEAVDGYKWGVVKQIWSYPILPEIVRCRDCKHFTPKGTHKFENGKVNADYCDYVRGWLLQITPDGFCAWGERRG